MVKSNWPLGLGAAIVVAGLTGLWLQQSPQQGLEPNPPAAVGAGDSVRQPGPAVSASSRPETVAPATAGISHQTPSSLGPEPFAGSLSGTSIDGRLAANAQGELLLETATRDFFDYFLNTVGEVSPERALAEIERLAREHLPPAAAQQALALLDDYLTYKREAVALGNRPLDPGQARDPAYQLTIFQQALAELKALRRDVFSPEAHSAFFGLEEAYGDYTLANLALQQREDLSPAARNALMEWHRQQLPPAIRQTEQRLHQDSERHQQYQRVLANADSTAAAGEQLRQLGLAEEQVGQVVSYLEERASFDTRYQAFEAELNQLQAAGLAEQDLAERRSALLEQHFASEQTRTWARLRGLEHGDQP